MKRFPTSALLLAILALVPLLPGCGPQTGQPAVAAGSATTETPREYPVTGVVRRVEPERRSVVVKHEEIPGFMRAMTMMFKVDAATLKSARKGDAITALMSRQGDEWILEEVRPAKAK